MKIGRKRFFGFLADNHPENVWGLFVLAIVGKMDGAGLWTVAGKNVEVGACSMKFSGSMMIILAAICWGITGGLIYILLSKGWNPLVISFYRGAFGLLCFGAWFAISRKGEKIFSVS